MKILPNRYYTVKGKQYYTNSRYYYIDVYIGNDRMTCYAIEYDKEGKFTEILNHGKHPLITEEFVKMLWNNCKNMECEIR